MKRKRRKRNMRGEGGGGGGGRGGRGEGGGGSGRRIGLCISWELLPSSPPLHTLTLTLRDFNDGSCENFLGLHILFVGVMLP